MPFSLSMLDLLFAVGLCAGVALILTPSQRPLHNPRQSHPLTLVDSLKPAGLITNGPNNQESSSDLNPTSSNPSISPYTTAQVPRLPPVAPSRDNDSVWASSSSPPSTMTPFEHLSHSTQPVYSTSRRSVTGRNNTNGTLAASLAALLIGRGLMWLLSSTTQVQPHHHHPHSRRSSHHL